MRESTAALQQQLHVLTLEKQAELKKSVKVIHSQDQSTRRKGNLVLAMYGRVVQHAAHGDQVVCVLQCPTHRNLPCNVVLLKLVYILSDSV